MLRRFRVSRVSFVLLRRGRGAAARALDEHHWGPRFGNGAVHVGLLVDDGSVACRWPRAAQRKDAAAGEKLKSRTGLRSVRDFNFRPKFENVVERASLRARGREWNDVAVVHRLVRSVFGSTSSTLQGALGASVHEAERH